MSSIIRTTCLTFLSFAYSVIQISVATAQVTGTKYIPGDFAKLADAFTAIKNTGVSGTVTLNVAAGYSEVAPLGGFRLERSNLSVTNNLVVKKNGIGANPLLIANTGSSAFYDAVFYFVGIDYVTVDGIDVTEKSGNDTEIKKMEMGFVFVGGGLNNGCGNNTIKNCEIKLDKSHVLTKGIASLHIGVNGAVLQPTSVFGSHRNNKIYTNTIKNCFYGIYLKGSSTNQSIRDANNDIGGSSAETGNLITEFGGASNKLACGVFLAYQNDANASNNIINNDESFSAGHQGRIYGIYDSIGTNFSAGKNTITLTIGAINLPPNSQYPSSCITTDAGGMNTITNNSLAGRTLGRTSTSFHAVDFKNGSSYTINDNTFTNSSINTPSEIIFVYSNITGLTNKLVVNNNTFTANPTLSAGVTFYGIYVNGAPRLTSVEGNTFSDLHIDSKYFSLITLYASGAGNLNISNNAITNVVGDSSSSSIYGEGFDTIFITNNNISSLRCSKSASAIVVKNADDVLISGNSISTIKSTLDKAEGISIRYAFNSTMKIHNNAITDLVSGINGIGLSYGATGINFTGQHNILNISNNKISNLVSEGQNVLTAGIYGDGSIKQNNIFRNKISNLSALGFKASVRAIDISSTDTLNIYNNVINALYTPKADAGYYSTLALGVGEYVKRANVFYNTVELTGETSGNGISTTALLAYSNAILRLNNNIFVNNINPGPSGISTAFVRYFRWFETPNLSSYSSLSNNNLLYSGSPGARNLLYRDGLNDVETLAGYKALMVDRDQKSVTEKVLFISSDVGSPGFLKPDPINNTFVESKGKIIEFTNDDLLTDNIRSGYPKTNQTNGEGIYPDLGAYEFDGKSAAISLCPGVNSLIASNISGSAYQWQVNTGNGFENITSGNHYEGVNTNTLQLKNVPSTFNGYEYQCLVDGKVSKTSLLKIISNWIGSVDNNWSNEGNWECGAIPDINTDVIIISGSPVITANVFCRSIYLKPGASISIQANNTLTVASQQ